MKAKIQLRSSPIFLAGILFILINISNIFALIKEKVKIIQLRRVAEIKEGFSSEEPNFFWRITGICHDRQDNFYVIDSGHNLIFKFNPDGKFIASFGRKGQGPGEFMGSSGGGSNLRLSFGNDGNLYVMDIGNQRLSIFSPDGQFLRQFPVPERLLDSATVNSRGDIYLLSKSGIKLIDCYDLNFKYKFSLLDIELHLQFPYEKPSFFLLDGFRYPQDHEIQKKMTRKDSLVVLSNNSLRTFVFDPSNTLIREFEIKEKGFVEDLIKRLKEMKKREESWRKKYPGLGASFISPFKIFFDYSENLCLSYPMSNDDKTLIWRYKLDGTFLDILKLPERVIQLSFSCDSSGKIYAVKGEFTEIGIYEIKKGR